MPTKKSIASAKPRNGIATSKLPALTTLELPARAFEPDMENLPGFANTLINDGVYMYRSSASGLSHGTSLGNARVWVASKGTGEMESFYSVESGVEVIGALTINYFSSDYELLDRDTRTDDAASHIRTEPRTPLPPVQHGEFFFHPAYQQRSMIITGRVGVLETLFVPRAAGLDEKAAVYHVVRLTNHSAVKRSITVIGALNLSGATPNDMHGRYASDIGALVAWNANKRHGVRVFGVSPSPDEYALTVDVEQAYYPAGRQDGHTSATGEIFGVLGRTVVLGPDESATLSFLAVYSPEAEDMALATYATSVDNEAAFRQTVSLYRDLLRVSDVRTPDCLLNQGAQWSKANMLRVLQRYHSNPRSSVVAFTNDPGKGSNIVVRDVCWFSIGCDYFLPDITADMLMAVALLQQAGGKIVEYWSGLTGATEDYGLNINDNTPLFIVAAAHHVHVTADVEWANAIYPYVERAARYLLSQRDDRGLVYCDATGTGAHGIAGWRNIIDGRNISGAVTEINSECYLALRDTASLAEIAGHAAAAKEFAREAATLKLLINEHLRNEDNGLYYLTINAQGQHESTVTADQVFPMIFQVADKPAMGRIMDRLLMPDFLTEAGLRTLSSKNPLYRPDALAGLMGGVWPGLTWWFALGCAHAESGIIAEALVISYRHYLRDPGTYNTVPGQFSEWFDGETLINRGMRLSPWEPPRFLWAAIEGAMGFNLIESSRDDVHGNTRIGQRPHLSPVVPESWKWFGVLNVPFRNGDISYFACMMNNDAAKSRKSLRYFGAGDFDCDAAVTRYDRNCSEAVRSHVGDVTVTAFAASEGTVDERFLLAVGSMSDEARVVLIDCSRIFNAKSTYSIKTYMSESSDWAPIGQQKGSELTRIATRVEAHGFRLYQIDRV